MDRCCGFTPVNGRLLGLCLRCAHLTLYRCGPLAEPARDGSGVYGCAKFEPAAWPAMRGQG